MRCTEAQLETLSTALDGYTRASLPMRGADGTSRVEYELYSAAYRAECRALNRLEDAAVSCGMSRDEPSVSEWASARIAEWLLSAPLTA